MPPDTDADICPWRVRDPATWRAGVLFTASANFLVQWHTVSAGLPPDIRADIEDRFGDLVDRVQWARLAHDLDGIEAAGRVLADLVAATPAEYLDLQAVVARFDQPLAEAGAGVDLCLLGCHGCEHPAATPDPRIDEDSVVDLRQGP